jgi:hypothetical protein
MSKVLLQNRVFREISKRNRPRIIFSERSPETDKHQIAKWISKIKLRGLPERHNLDVIERRKADLSAPFDLKRLAFSLGRSFTPI